MHQPYMSETFFHMVGWSILRSTEIAPENKNEESYKRLKEILSFGFIAGRNEYGKREHQECIVEICTDSNGHLRNGDFEGFLAKGVITCYADIPFKSLGLHASKYGLFGFGVSSQYLAAAGARPVSYVPTNRNSYAEPNYRGHGLLDNMTQEILSLHRVVDAWEDKHNLAQEDGSRAVENQHPQSNLLSILTRDIAAFIKPFDKDLPFDDPECYYSEREWRLLGNVEIKLPHVTMIIVAKGYEDRLRDEVPFARQFDIQELNTA